MLADESAPLQRADARARTAIVSSQQAFRGDPFAGCRICPFFGTAPLLNWPHQREKEGRNMEFLTWLFTICGAATLARGVMAVIDVLEKE